MPICYCIMLYIFIFFMLLSHHFLGIGNFLFLYYWILCVGLLSIFELKQSLYPYEWRQCLSTSHPTQILRVALVFVGFTGHGGC
ncbi:hypothetical protein Hanom_Chr14g01329921 [Helianthus anomalus]